MPETRSSGVLGAKGKRFFPPSQELRLIHAILHTDNLFISLLINGWITLLFKGFYVNILSVLQNVKSSRGIVGIVLL